MKRARRYLARSKAPEPLRDIMPALLALVCLAWTGAALASDHDLPFMDYLDNEHRVCIKWGLDEAGGSITLKLVVNTTGWIGFGLSPNGDMAGADMVMGGLGPDGPYFKDYYSAENSYPVEDLRQSYTLLAINESQGQTLMTFARPLQTCDDQDLPITAQAMKLIYAYGTSDKIGYHAALAGTKELNLLNYVSRATPANGSYIDATMENIAIPPQETYYHCRVVKFPNLLTKHHIVQFEPAIANMDLVHHMLLYSCPSSVTTAYDGECYQGHEGDDCFEIIGAWAVGGQILDLPENTGIPVGGGDNGGFYRLEIHYNNANKESGRTDSSGLRLHYTDQLRPHDMGILSTGVTPIRHAYYDIPPRATRFRTYGVCNTSLFSQIMDPVPDLQVFAVMMHTHTAGKQVRVAHFRDGEQLGFLAMNLNYDFNLQGVTKLGSVKTVKPGDDIVVECSYSTSDRTEPTQMGLATTEEMCLAFLLFYPKMPIVSCLSQPNVSQLNHQFPLEGSVSDQKEIEAYEKAVKNLWQIEFISTNEKQFHVNPYGRVPNLTDLVPSFRCEHTGNAGITLSASRTWNVAAALLPLVWVGTMG